MKKKELSLIRIFIIVTIVLAIIFGGFLVGRNVAAASDAPRTRYYTSITVGEGDTLWSIAGRFCDSTDSIDAYIDDLKEMNGIVNERALTAGCSLMIYYME